MPAKSARQQKFMAICSKHPGEAHGECPSHEVAEEFSHKGDYDKEKKAGVSKLLARMK